MANFVKVAEFPNYEISPKGEVRRIATGKILKPRISHYGYGIVNLYYPDKLNNTQRVRVNRSIHRLVAKAFIPNPENKPCVNHKDGNKMNNSVDNLEWVTQQENIRHAFATGLKKVKKVFYVEKNLVFNTVKECAEYLNLSSSTIYAYINNTRKIPEGITLKYLEEQNNGL